MQRLTAKRLPPRCLAGDTHKRTHGVQASKGLHDTTSTEHPPVRATVTQAPCATPDAPGEPTRICESARPTPWHCRHTSFRAIVAASSAWAESAATIRGAWPRATIAAADVRAQPRTRWGKCSQSQLCSACTCESFRSTCVVDLSGLPWMDVTRCADHRDTARTRTVTVTIANSRIVRTRPLRFGAQLTVTLQCAVGDV